MSKMFKTLEDACIECMQKADYKKEFCRKCKWKTYFWNLKDGTKRKLNRKESYNNLLSERKKQYANNEIMAREALSAHQFLTQMNIPEVIQDKQGDNVICELIDRIKLYARIPV